MEGLADEWFVELQGARVVATAGPDGYELSLTDPQWQRGSVVHHEHGFGQLADALPVARALLEHHLRTERNLTGRPRPESNGGCEAGDIALGL